MNRMKNDISVFSPVVAICCIHFLFHMNILERKDKRYNQVDSSADTEH